jgi:hypothetical protein
LGIIDKCCLNEKKCRRIVEFIYESDRRES